MLLLEVCCCVSLVVVRCSVCGACRLLVFVVRRCWWSFGVDRWLVFVARWLWHVCYFCLVFIGGCR